MKNKVMLIIMDGVGAAPSNNGNAVVLSNPENLIRYWNAYPHTYLKASSEAVGLPPKTNGNSEVGHLNIGAGKVVLQNLPKINYSISTERFYSNTTLVDALNHAQQFGSSIHLMGCMSDGSVHAHVNHYIAVLEFFARKGFKGNLYIHAFTDGRDSPSRSAGTFLTQIQEKIDQAGVGEVATVCGRAFAMDRNETWARTLKAYQLLTEGKGTRCATWKDALAQAYNSKQIDEYIEPCIITKGNKLPTVQENDAVIFMNFRADRSLQMTDAFIDPKFSAFQVKRYNNLFYAAMVEYKREYPKRTLFPKEYVNMSIGRIVSENGLRQLRIAESEKFPHVTYFFNGGTSLKYNGEDRIEIPSPSVPTYDLKPEMSAFEILKELSERISASTYDFIVLNLANGDMVGHTGNLEACIKAMQVVDYCVDQLVKQFVSLGGTVLLTADHGNVEEVINLKTGEIDTEHSQNAVPFIVVNETLPKTKLPLGSLCDIAPTILNLMHIDKPSDMSGKSLI